MELYIPTGLVVTHEFFPSSGFEPLKYPFKGKKELGKFISKLSMYAYMVFLIQKTFKVSLDMTIETLYSCGYSEV